MRTFYQKEFAKNTEIITNTYSTVLRTPDAPDQRITIQVNSPTDNSQIDIQELS